MARDVVFVDEVNFRSVLYIVLRAYKTRHVRYFEPLTSPWNQAWFHFLLRMIGVDFSIVTQNMEQVRNCEGREAYLSIFRDVWKVCEVIRRDHLERSSFLRSLEGLWNVEKLIFHFLKMIELELRAEFLRVRLAGSIIEAGPEILAADSYMLVGRGAWHDYYVAYAAEHGVVAKAYSGSTIPFVKIASLTYGVATKLWRVICSRAKGLLLRGRQVQDQRGDNGAGGVNDNSPKIGLRYFHRSVSFDPEKRSEFFWLHDAKMQLSDVVLYDYAPRVPEGNDGQFRLSVDAVQAEFHERGVGLYGMREGIPRWMPSYKSVGIFLGALLTLVSRWLLDRLQGGELRFSYFSSTLALAGQFAYWVDFYQQNKILLNLTVNVYSSSAQVLAMDRVGGVSLSYQYSCADYVYDYPVWLSAGEDAHLVFSSFLRPYLDSVKTPTRHMLEIGYPYSSFIESLKGSAEVGEIRSDLARHGAECVISFFDENSVDLWYATGAHEKPQEYYEFLLTWLLEDPTLGLVIKPKSAPNLIARLGPVAELLERALATGRCRILMSDRVVGETYPAKVALMSDLSIGIAMGATAALEARLAGVPTLLIEHNEMVSGVFKGRKTEQIVFNDWTDLRRAVEKWRNDEPLYAGLGDWSEFLADLDPFDDGKASERIDGYVSYLYTALAQGVGKDQALEDASARYSEKWGRQDVR